MPVKPFKIVTTGLAYMQEGESGIECISSIWREIVLPAILKDSIIDSPRIQIVHYDEKFDHSHPKAPLFLKHCIAELSLSDIMTEKSKFVSGKPVTTQNGNFTIESSFISKNYENDGDYDLFLMHDGESALPKDRVEKGNILYFGFIHDLSSQKYWKFNNLLKKDTEGNITNLEKIIYDKYKDDIRIRRIFEKWEPGRDLPVDQLVNEIIREVKKILMGIIRNTHEPGTKRGEIMENVDRYFLGEDPLYFILNQLLDVDTKYYNEAKDYIVAKLLENTSMLTESLQKDFKSLMNI